MFTDNNTEQTTKQTPTAGTFDVDVVLMARPWRCDVQLNRVRQQPQPSPQTPSNPANQRLGRTCRGSRRPQQTLRLPLTGHKQVVYRSQLLSLLTFTTRSATSPIFVSGGSYSSRNMTHDGSCLPNRWYR